jgi:hypothetical protein
MFVKGPHRHDIQFSIGPTDPKGYFEVQVDSPKTASPGRTVRYLVTVAIPPGSEPINRLGSETAPYGRIVLLTTHPQIKQIPICVKYAVD